MAKHAEKKAVIVISSHVARGSVGNRAAVFALETLGFPVWAIPTILLPWHPGHGPATRIVPNSSEFGNFLEDVAAAPWIDEIGGILTGYMASVEQVKQVAGLVEQIGKMNPAITYICDPVIGDEAGLYVEEDIASAIRDLLIPQCKIATPNRFELAWLSNSKPAEDPGEVVAQLKKLGRDCALVTSCPTDNSTETGNLFVDKECRIMATHEKHQNPPNGPGDLTAAIFLGHYLSGLPQKNNLQMTTSSVLEIVEQSSKRGSDELTLESDTASIVHPKMNITLVKLPRN